MERLGLVELHAVLRAQLVGVRVLLSAPVGAVPVLSVRGVARCELARLQGHHIQGVRVFEPDACVARSPVVLLQVARLEVACAESGRALVNRVHVRCAAHLRLGAIAARSGVQLHVGFRDGARVEASGGERILVAVESLVGEDFAGLLSQGLAEVVVVLSDLGPIPLISWNHSRLLLNRNLINTAK